MKRLLLFLDGTWNAETGAHPVTNVIRLREMLDHRASGDDPRAAPRIRHRVYYDEGVGTGRLRLDKCLGGAFGIGLATNIRQAYRFLSANYSEPSHPGDHPDEIYVFGFSRGAFTARSLIGWISASGLLKQEFCTEERLSELWTYYRQPPNERSPAARAGFDPFVHSPKITCLGVFDTVGALGIPEAKLPLAEWLNQRFSFHDTALGSSVRHCFHAVAIDEERWPFRPAIWVRPPHNSFESVEQVWFSGAHADVGGGYEHAMRGDIQQPISSFPLDWMMKRVSASTGLRFHEVKHWLLDDRAWHKQHSAFGGVYKRFGRTSRLINTILPEKSGDGSDWRIATIARHLSPIGEAVHESALRRIGCPIAINGVGQKYRPPNLLAVLNAIAETYAVEPSAVRRFHYDMKIARQSDGKHLAPDVPEEAEFARSILQAARHSLLGKPPPAPLGPGLRAGAVAAPQTAPRRASGSEGCATRASIASAGTGFENR